MKDDQRKAMFANMNKKGVVQGKLFSKKKRNQKKAIKKAKKFIKSKPKPKIPNKEITTAEFKNMSFSDMDKIRRKNESKLLNDVTHKYVEVHTNHMGNYIGYGKENLSGSNIAWLLDNGFNVRDISSKNKSEPIHIRNYFGKDYLKIRSVKPTKFLKEKTPKNVLVVTGKPKQNPKKFGTTEEVGFR